MESPKIIATGTPIITVIGNIKALVTGACLRGAGLLSYEISYFMNGVHHCVWVAAVEIKIDEVNKKPAGLVNYETAITIIQ